MTIFNPNSNFIGQLSGQKGIDLISKLDYKINNFKDRYDLVIGILSEYDPFLVSYFDSYFLQGSKYSNGNFKENNFILKSNDETSEYNNICKYLQTIGSYLLNSPDLESPKKVKYNIYTNEQEFKDKISKFTSLNTMEETELDFLLTNVKNKLVFKALEIEAKDLNSDEYIGEVLRDYNKLKNYYINVIRVSKESPSRNISLEYKAKKQAASIKDDMILTKLKLQRPIEFKAPLKSSNKPNYDLFDFNNKEHVKSLLRVKRTKIAPDDDVSLLVDELNYIINELFYLDILDDTDIEIIKLYRQEENLSEIGKRFHINKASVSKRISKIVHRICTNYNKLY